jgi:indolepyruvate ferredoxin oxidoreductase
VALELAIRTRAGAGALHAIDAQRLSTSLFGDSIFANMILLGFAFQLGHIPISAEAIDQAIALNGASVETNRQAFRWGRRAAARPEDLAPFLTPGEAEPPLAKSLDEIVAYRAADLADYQDQTLAARYRQRVESMAALERAKAPGLTGLAETVARAYHKLLAYKDEYEVARLITDGRLDQAIAEQFEGVRKVEFHFAPPLLARRNRSTGEPIKMRFGPWVRPVLHLLAKGKKLRGTRFDPFAYSKERRTERQLIADYERLLDELAECLSPATHATALSLAALPMQISGFGHVKAASLEKVRARERGLLDALRSITVKAERYAAE